MEPKVKNLSFFQKLFPSFQYFVHSMWWRLHLQIKSVTETMLNNFSMWKSKHIFPDFTGKLKNKKKICKSIKTYSASKLDPGSSPLQIENLFGFSFFFLPVPTEKQHCLQRSAKSLEYFIWHLMKNDCSKYYMKMQMPVPKLCTELKRMHLE